MSVSRRYVEIKRPYKGTLSTVNRDLSSVDQVLNWWPYVRSDVDSITDAESLVSNGTRSGRTETIGLAIALGVGGLLSILIFFLVRHRYLRRSRRSSTQVLSDESYNACRTGMIGEVVG